ncbi:hypothetical protein T484DRAFT_1743634 [Baffinella frigidus]|nr:hypothetical protein T484DRAFT_1743634 [Cryptophyta sp. CCMP2293]
MTTTMPMDADAAAHPGHIISLGGNWFGTDAPPMESSAEMSESEKAALRGWLATMVGDDAGMSAGVNYTADHSDLPQIASDHSEDSPEQDLLVDSPEQDLSEPSSTPNSDLFVKLVLRTSNVEKRKCLFECPNDKRAAKAPCSTRRLHTSPLATNFRRE